MLAIKLLNGLIAGFHFASLPGKHGQTDPVRTVQIDPFKTA